MFAVNRFFAKVQLFLQNTYCLQHFFLHKACGALAGRVRKKAAGKSASRSYHTANLRCRPSVRVCTCSQRASFKTRSTYLFCLNMSKSTFACSSLST